MERLSSSRPTSGLHTGNLRAWAMLFAIAGIVSRSILQNRLLGVGSNSMQELLEMMQTSETAMIIGMAVVTEIPFDLAMNGKVLEFGKQNPVIGLVLCMVLLYLLRRFAGKKLICVIMTLAGLLWALMLKVDHGIPMVLMICVIHLFRNKRMFMGFSGMAAAALCTGLSPFYLIAPMGFLASHFYNGEEGNGSKLVNYLIYTVTLLAIGLIAKFAF